MRPIPPKMKEEMAADPFYKKCARIKDGECRGRVTIEHAIIFSGRQLNELWALLPLCSYHHSVDQYQDGPGLDKRKNWWIALNRATDEQLKEYSRAEDLIQKRDWLNSIYGVWGE